MGQAGRGPVVVIGAEQAGLAMLRWIMLRLAA